MTYKEFNKQFENEIKKLEVEHPELIGTNNSDLWIKYDIKRLEEIIKNVNDYV